MTTPGDPGPIGPYRLRDYYRTSLSLGLRGLAPRHLKDCAARLLNPLSYPRYLEFRLALDGLAPRPGQRILDLGSPKLPLYLLAREPLSIHATDIRDYFIPGAAHFLGRLGLGAEIGRRVFLETQDGRALSYPDGFFDGAYSISVVEHIPDGGDALAMRELRRVLRPGGRLSLTVPYGFDRYSETWLRSDVYERTRTGAEKVFYERRYDDAALRQRLVEPSGMRLERTVWFGEPHFHFERLWNAFPVWSRLPLLWAAPLFARCFLHPLPEARRDRAVGVALVLVREGA